LDGEALETLKDAGFEQGDYLPLYSYNQVAARSVSTTSTTYTYSADFFITAPVWVDFFPSGLTTQVKCSVRAVPGADETVDLRVRNTIDGETVAEKTGLTADNVYTFGPTTYTPTTTGSRVEIFIQWRTSPGTNSLIVEEPMMTFGVEI